MKITTLALLAVLQSALVARGQYAPMDQSNSRSLYIKTGFNYTVLATQIGFKKYLFRYKTAVVGEMTQTLTAPGFGNMKLKAEAQPWFNVYGKLWLSPQVGFSWTRGKTKASRLEALGTHLQLSTILSLSRFHFGFDMAYDPVLGTYVKHSDEYRTYFYPDAKDGWYTGTARYYRLGATVGYTLNQAKTYELTGEGGIQKSGQFDQLIPNLYFQLGLCKKFN